MERDEHRDPVAVNEEEPIDVTPVEETEAVGRQLFVRVAELGATPTEVAVVEGATVQEVLTRANVSQGLEVRKNGQPANLQDPVQDGDTLVALPKVRGGIR